MVEDVFALTRGLILAPHLPQDAPPRGPLRVVLVRPDGSSLLADGTIEHPLYNPPPPYFAIALLISGIDKQAVPPGTRVYLEP